MLLPLLLRFCLISFFKQIITTDLSERKRTEAHRTPASKRTSVHSAFCMYHNFAVVSFVFCVVVVGRAVEIAVSRVLLSF